MKLRFSTRAFGRVTLTYLALTFLLGLYVGRLVDAAEAAGHPATAMYWLDISTWIWTPVPRLILYIFPALVAYYVVFVLAWSLSIGLLFGFLAPRIGSMRHRFI